MKFMDFVSIIIGFSDLYILATIGFDSDEDPFEWRVECFEQVSAVWLYTIYGELHAERLFESTF